MKICKSPAEAVREMWKEQFFQSWKKQPEIMDFLATQQHHFNPSLISKALQRAKFLTRRGSRGTFDYIQKHPYTDEVKKND